MPSPKGDPPEDEPKPQKLSEPVSVPLPSAEQELARVGQDRKPVYMLDHERRTSEAKVALREVAAAQAKDDRDMRKDVAHKVFEAIIVQVVVADLAFLVYGFWKGWEIPGSTMSAWLGATVIQVIAVGLVITRSLFPKKDTLGDRLSALLGSADGDES